MIPPSIPPDPGDHDDTTARQARHQRQFWLRAIYLSIGTIVIPPLFGMAQTVVNMAGAFQQLSDTGEIDHNALASQVGIALIATAWGLLISTFGVIALIISVIRFLTLPKPPDLPRLPERSNSIS